MSDAGDTAAEEALLLELAQLGMGMARRLHDAAQDTTDALELVALSTAYHHVGRGVRQSLALKARFAAGSVVRDSAAPQAAATQAAATQVAAEPSDEEPQADAYESPDWHTPAAANERLEALDPDDDVCRARIARNLTVVSRNPGLAVIPALRAPAAHLAGRAALLTGAALRLVNSS